MEKGAERSGNMENGKKKDETEGRKGNRLVGLEKWSES